MNSLNSRQLTLSGQFVDRILSLKELALTDQVIHQTKRVLLDYLGVGLAGSNLIKENPQFNLASFFEEAGKSTVIGFEEETTIHHAILINGLSSHITELDDGHRFGMIHLGAPIISAILPLAEARNLSGQDVLQGIALGYEAAVRIASSIQPFHRNQGFHTTGTCGTIGAAIGCAVALGYSKEKVLSTLSAAVTSAAGLLEIQEDGSDLKPYNAANAALNGFSAAQVAGAGFQGPHDILGGKRGFSSVISEINKVHLLNEPVDEQLEIERIYVKPYAACRHSHPAIEAAQNILKDHKIDYEAIDEIKIATYQAAVEGHDHQEILGVGSAKMSIPYSVAAALRFGKAGIDEFSLEHIQDQSVKKLMAKIEVRVDEGLTKLAPAMRAAVVDVKVQGNSFSDRVNYPLGEPENPMSDAEIQAKFIDLTKSLKSSAEIEEIIYKVWTVERDLQKLFRFLKG